MSEITPLDSASNVTSKRPARSEVWEHFTVADDGKRQFATIAQSTATSMLAYNKGGNIRI